MRTETNTELFIPIRSAEDDSYIFANPAENFLEQFGRNFKFSDIKRINTIGRNYSGNLCEGIELYMRRDFLDKPRSYKNLVIGVTSKDTPEDPHQFALDWSMFSLISLVNTHQPSPEDENYFSFEDYEFKGDPEGIKSEGISKPNYIDRTKTIRIPYRVEISPKKDIVVYSDNFSRHSLASRDRPLIKRLFTRPSPIRIEIAPKDQLLEFGYWKDSPGESYQGMPFEQVEFDD